MLPASLLPVEPGDAVLDLCAAPGGKTTELGAKLKGEGLLVSNDISVSRAKALLKNVELFGIKNAVVISEAPEKLAERLPEYFDKILVDAPCSGEGMFRKVHSIAKNWEQYGSEYYADIQRTVLPSAVKMLKPGGLMLYSTCTFSKKEDEDSIRFILESFPEMELIPAIDFIDPRYHGFERGYDGLDEAIRIYPHRVKGEGHFAALLRKKSGIAVMEDVDQVNSGIYEGSVESSAADNSTGKNKAEDLSEISIRMPNTFDSRIRSRYKKISDEAFDFFEKLGIKIDPARLLVNDDRIYLIPKSMPDFSKLRVLRTGLFLGEMKKGRFEPSEALAMALNKEQYTNILSLQLSDERVVRFLKCESIELNDNEAEDGYCLVCAGGYPLGWGKVDKGRFKNKYLPSWRLQ